MTPRVVSVNCGKIRDWPSFHDEFAAAFGFPSFYGRNMNAWIDCMTSLDEPEHGMSSVHSEQGGVVTLQLENVVPFRDQHPEIYAAIVECAAFVNWRKLEVGEPPVLCLSFRII